MAREVKIKVKQTNGSLGFTKVDLPENYRTEFSRNLDRSQKNGETIIRETREYELITPLFGGGAETKKADEVSVIRATEIRGHLRFWWRATRGGQFNGDIVEMKKHEDAIFGSTESHSVLQIEVEIINRGSDFGRPNELGYAWFPLRDTNGTLQKNIKFSATFSYPNKFKIFKKNRKGEIIKDENGKPTLEKDFDSSPEIQASLWAWENFGGVGARTRRGFGAICRTDDNSTQTILEFKAKTEILFNNQNETIIHSEFPVLKDANFRDITLDKAITWKDQLIKDQKNAHNANPRNRNRPFSSKLEKMSNAEIIWTFLISKLQNFRQSPRNIVQFRGESHWSEPDAIRLITTDYASYRKPTHLVGKKFPRVNFGLPIEFKFKDSDSGDPEKQTLEGKDKEQARLSSPLILRPVVCSDGVIGIALVLNTLRKPPKGIHLKGYSNPIVIDLDVADIAHIEPMQFADPKETDVLKSFLKYLEK